MIFLLFAKLTVNFPLTFFFVTVILKGEFLAAFVTSKSLCLNSILFSAPDLLFKSERVIHLTQ